MSRAVLNSEEGALSLEWARDYDYELTVTIRSRGYSGSVEVHVDEAKFRKFSEDLLELERKRQGAATVNSMSPRELKLTLRSSDMLGHMEAVGEIASTHYSRNGAHEHVLRFGFEFDPSELALFANGLATA